MNQPTTQPPAFRARLTEAGLAVEDSAALCAEYTRTFDWSEVRRRALEENLLDKGSEARITKLLRAVERRVLHALPPLSSPRPLAGFLGSPRVADTAKAQLLFVLTAREDAALAEGYWRLIVPALTGFSRRAPAKAEIVGFLKEVAQVRPEVARWTDQTRLRWAEGFRLVMREAGFLTTGPGNQEALQPPVPRPETVCLLCHAVADAGVSGWPILRHEVLRLLLLADADAVRGARTLQDRGWWNFAQNDALVEFRRNHASLEQWLDHVLGH
jgi:hypothetical protein